MTNLKTRPAGVTTSCLLAAVLAFAAASASAQPGPAVPAAAPAAATADGAGARPCCRLPAGTVVVIELAQRITTKTFRPGDRFEIRLAETVVVDGKSLIPAGAHGAGEVIDAAPAGSGGRAAKLVLAVRYIETGGVRVPLHALQLGRGGENRLTETIVATEAAGVFGLLVKGGEVSYPEGFQADAKVAADVQLTPVQAAPAGSTPASGTPPTTGELK
jgi:hypothetical protein